MTSRDDVIQRLNAEVGKLRNFGKDKANESSRQKETLHQIQEALTKSQMTLEETRNNADQEVSIM